MGAIISLIIAIVTAIATYAVMRNNVDRLVKENEKQKADIDNLEKFKNENAQRIEYLMKASDELKQKAQEQSESITSLKEKVAQAPTMKEVRQEFVSKEMFNQMQKHIDEKFQMVQSGIQKILEKLD